MARPASSRFYLADLMMAALLCGLVLALPTSARRPADAGLIFLLILVVGASWALLRHRRHAPACEECGQGFIRPNAPAALAGCPHCGREQPGWERSIGRANRIGLGLMGLMAFLAVAAAIAFIGFTGGPHEKVVEGAGMLLVACVIFTLIALLDVFRHLSRLTREERPCEACGAPIPARPPCGTLICPRCRIWPLRPTRRGGNESGT